MHRPPLHRGAAGLAALALGVGLAACSAGPGPEGEPSSASAGADGTEDASADGAGDAAFPVTVEHTFGATQVPSAPARVVTVGFNDQDFALALGTVPVGVRDYVGYDEEERPWAADLLPDEPLPTVGGQEGIDVEAVAALRPDLILGVYSFMEEDVYEQLSQIAPTIAESADHGAGGTPWQEQTLMTGRALGQEEEAQALVDDVEGAFTDAVAAHPGWQGQSLALDYALDGHYLLGADDLRSTFFSDLGFEVDADSTPLSQEALDVLDRDVLVVGGAAPEQYGEDQLFQALDVVAQERTFFLGAFDTDRLAALGFASPLSLPYALGSIVPGLAAAADGDPATPVPAPEA